MIRSKPLSAKKPPRCKFCRQPFERSRPGQLVCNPECGIKYAELLRDKKLRAEAKQVRAVDKKRKEALKSR